MILKEIDYEMKDFSKKIRKNSMKLVKTKLKDYDIKLFVKKKLLQVNSNLNKIDQALSNEMIEQMSEFEENKRKRKVKKSQNNIIININYKGTNENQIKENEIIKNEEINKEKDKKTKIKEEKKDTTKSSGRQGRQKKKKIEEEEEEKMKKESFNQ